MLDRFYVIALLELVLSGGKPNRDKLLHVGLPALLEAQLQENDHLKQAAQLKKRVIKLLKEVKVWEAAVPQT